jgi:hypothetical protein
MDEIARRYEQAVRDPALRVLCAGSTRPLPGPGGLAEILRRSSLGKTGERIIPGLTLIKSAAAFKAPEFITTNSVVKDGYKRHHYATVQRTEVEDVVHESFYVAPGDHLQPVAGAKTNGSRLKRYWRVSASVSDLVRRAEQEHLDDARRAFDLTYGKIAGEINALANQKFGPADSPDEAHGLALKALAARLPKELGTDPANWVKVLERLLGQSAERDAKGWHFAEIGEVRQERDRIVDVVKSSSWANIGVASDKVVRY